MALKIIHIRVNNQALLRLVDSMNPDRKLKSRTEMYRQKAHLWIRKIRFSYDYQ
jgi:hypothetical protein